MNLSLTSDNLLQHQCDVLLVPVFHSEEAAAPLTEIDKALNGLLLNTARQEDFDGKREHSLLIHTHARLGSQQILLLGLGSRQEFNIEELRQAIGIGVKTAKKAGARSVCVVLWEKESLLDWIGATTEGLVLGNYEFSRYKTAPKNDSKALAQATLWIPVENQTENQSHRLALQAAQDLANATNWTRDLVNEPANGLTPTRLGQLAKDLADERNLQFELHDREGIEKLRMGMFLGVAQGSQEPPVLMRLSWIPEGENANKPAISLVGKAITFDSGGLCLKPSNSMSDMKTDMAGAAAVLGTMRVVATLRPPFPVHAYVGACENMPSGKAFRPGDVLLSRLGKTVEVINTDAEGRLVLGDVIAWATETKPAILVDIATLTGACSVALGNYITGLFGTDESAVQQVLDAAQVAGEEIWRLPISKLQQGELESDIADLKNSGERWGGAINAALFLKEFAGNTPWVHLDIAGPATSPKERGYFSKGATGVGVRTLVQLIRTRMAR